MFEQAMEPNDNSLNPVLKYTTENFDDIEKESKQNQKQFYNGEESSLRTSRIFLRGINERHIIKCYII